MIKKYIVRLSDAERGECEQIVKKLKGGSQKVRRAQILLKSDADGPAWTDLAISAAFNCRTRTIENLRQRVLVEGFASALHGKQRENSPTPPKLRTTDLPLQIQCLAVCSGSRWREINCRCVGIFRSGCASNRYGRTTTLTAMVGTHR